MPELPEVERARALVEERGLGRRIAAVDDTDSYVCRPHQPGEIAAGLVGHELVAACRRGKAMWFQTGDGPSLGLHLGMAGRLIIDGAGAGDPAPIDDAKRVSKWERFVIDFSDGGHLILFDKRRLGRAVLNPDLSGVGPDAMDISRDEFRARVGRGELPLKAKLMDQSVLAGVGNLLADELLWQARQSPLRPAGSLSDEELDDLRRVMRASTRRAIKLGGVHTGELIEHRRARGDHICPRCGADLRRATVGGRTTWWCPREQTEGV